MIKFTEIDADYEGRELTQEDIFAIGQAVFHSKGIFNQDDYLHTFAKNTVKLNKNISELLDILNNLAKKFKNNP